MTAMLTFEPTYDQFCGTFRYLHAKTPYAVQQPKYLVNLIQRQPLTTYLHEEQILPNLQRMALGVSVLDQ